MDKLTREQIERELEDLELENDYQLRVRRRRAMDGSGWIIWIQTGRGANVWCSDPVVNALTLAVAIALVRVMLEVMTKPNEEPTRHITAPSI